MKKIPSANAGVYYYPAQKGKAKIEFKAGRGIELIGHGDEEYKWPAKYLFPEETDKNIIFPINGGRKM